MTPSQAAQEKSTSPRDPCDWAGWTPLCAIHGEREAAAATPSLDVRLPSVEALAYALERVRDPDEPRRTVIPTGYSTMLSSEVPAVRRRQAELLLAFLKESGVAARLDEGSATPDQAEDGITCDAAFEKWGRMEACDLPIDHDGPHKDFWTQVEDEGVESIRRTRAPDQGKGEPR